MKLRHGENSNVVDSDYLHVQLKTILEKKKIDKKFMYKVEWMDGTQDWVLEKRIQHESVLLSKFECMWWKDKRKREKEGENKVEEILLVKEEVEIKEEDYSVNIIKGKSLASLKGKKINIYENVNNGNIMDNNVYNNNSTEDLNKMNAENSNVIINIKVEPKENLEDDLVSLEKHEINTFDIKKILKPKSKSHLKKKKLKNNILTRNQKLNDKTKNTNIEQIMLNNKRERVDEDSNINYNEAIKINYPSIKIIDFEDTLDVEYLVEWEQREDGTIPTISLISEAIAQEKYPDMLIDFLSKTLRDKDIKKLEFPLN